MKKLIAILLAAMLMVSLAACGAEEEPNEDLVITRGAEGNEETVTQEEAPETDGGVYVFVAEGVELIPGAAFDPSVLGEPASVYEVPSCAIEGTDNVYSYGAYEITAYDDGTGEVIYSIYLADPSVVTPEGLAVSDDGAKVLELYGETYTEEGTSWIYTSGNTQLIVILQNDVVISIEYRMITE